eukprot:Sspe_Gene.90677::Locus_62179_Transcript_5_5_Confidence_0.462_Length_851::g.90677::m.90677
MVWWFHFPGSRGPLPLEIMGGEEGGWLKRMQEETAKTTFKADGGRVVRDEELPNWMVQPVQPPGGAVCSAERVAMQRCLQRRGMTSTECEEALAALNKCEQHHFTRAAVSEIGKATRESPRGRSEECVL